MRSFTIGTAESCDLRITDEYASPRHCEVFEDRSGQVWVRDLGSTNGTRIGPSPYTGQKVWGPTRLRPGDTLWVGRTRIPWTRREDRVAGEPEHGGGALGIGT